MTIDIIDLNDPEYSDLSAIQFAMVRAAQAEKDTVVGEYAGKLEDLFYHFVGRNTARSSALLRETAELEAERDAAVEAIRSELLYQLSAEEIGSMGNEYGPYRYPENPNYNLSFSQRFLVVREYYMKVTGDAKARHEAYRIDTLARTYLGEYYETLYDLLATYVK